MSKSKEQCIQIISQKLDSIADEKDFVKLIKAFEDTVISISGAEYGILWSYDDTKKILKNLKSQTEINMSVGESIVKTVLSSKKAFFDNHITAHKHYNKTIDNPLNIQIKSLLVVPILDKSKKSILGFYSSIKRTSLFWMKCREAGQSIILPPIRVKLLNVH